LGRPQCPLSRALIETHCGEYFETAGPDASAPVWQPEVPATAVANIISARNRCIAGNYFNLVVPLASLGIWA
jgi:hypothetical protein